MKFSSSHRRSDGRLETLEIEAESRAEAVRKLRAMGVVSLELKEVRGQGSGVRGQGLRRNIVLAVAGMVLIGIGVWFCLPRNSKIPQKQQKTETRAVAPATKKREPRMTVAYPKALPAAPQRIKRGVRPAVTNEVDVTKDHIEYLTVDGKKCKVLVLGQDTNTPRCVYENHVDAEIAYSMLPENSQVPSPWQGMFNEKKLREALALPVTVFEDDSEEVVRQKEYVAKLKEDMVRHIAAGGLATEYLAELKAESARALIREREVRNFILDLAEKGELEDARDVLEHINGRYREAGLKEIKLPPPVRAALRKLEDERK